LSVKDFDGQGYDVIISGILQVLCPSFISSFSLSLSLSYCLSLPYIVENDIYGSDCPLNSVVQISVL
jgi:hypothetical protein